MKKYLGILLISAVVGIGGCSTAGMYASKPTEEANAKRVLITANTGITVTSGNGMTQVVEANTATTDNRPKEGGKVFVADTTGISVTFGEKNNPASTASTPAKPLKVFGASTQNTSINYVTDGYDYSVYDKNAVLPQDYKDPTKIVIKQNPSDKTKKDIYLQNTRTGNEKIFITLSDVVRGYHYSRKNGNVYIILKNADTYELWLYDYQKKGKRLSKSARPEFQWPKD